MLIPKKNRNEVYKYLFRGAYSSHGCFPRFSCFLAELARRGFSLNSSVFYVAEGVIYAKKDFNLPKHPEIPEVPNLQVRVQQPRP